MTGSSSGKKHRVAAGSTSGTLTDSSSQVSSSTYQNVALDQLPLLSEESLDGDSTNTSPISRTDSIRSISTARSSLHTPAKLQPYLESEVGSEDTIKASNSSTDPHSEAEWIGPLPDSDHDQASEKPLDPLISNSVTARPRKVAGPGDVTSSRTEIDSSPRQIPRNASHDGESSASAINPGSLVSMWGVRAPDEQSLHPQPWGNPFLPFPQLSSPNASHQKVEAPALAPQAHMQLAHVPPAEVWHEAREHNPPMAIGGNFHDYPMAPSPPPQPPVPVHYPPANTYHNPHDYYSNHAMFDGSAQLLQRVGSAIPDLCAFMNLYQQTCSTLSYRDSQILELKGQKIAEAKRQSDRFEKLQTDLEHILNKNKAEIRKLKKDIASLESQYEKLEDRHAEEGRLKAAAVAAWEGLSLEQEEIRSRHQDERQSMHNHFTQEFEKLRENSVAKERALVERLQSANRNAEVTLSARVAELNRKHERDMQNLEANWKIERQELVDDGNHKYQELEKVFETTQKALNQEREKYIYSKSSWDTERESLLRTSKEERSLLTSRADERYQALIIRHKGSRDDLLKALEAAQARQKSEDRTVTLDLPVERDELPKATNTRRSQFWIETHEATEEAETGQQVVQNVPGLAESRKRSDLQETSNVMQQHTGDLQRSRISSQSRQNTETQASDRKQQKTADMLQVNQFDNSKSQNANMEPTATPTHIDKLQRPKETHGSAPNLKSKGSSAEQIRTDHSRRRHSQLLI